MDPLTDCHDCASRRGEAGEYRWWLRFASIGCDRAERDGKFHVPVPTRFAGRLTQALQWHGLAIGVVEDTKLPADLCRLRLEWQRDER